MNDSLPASNRPLGIALGFLLVAGGIGAVASLFLNGLELATRAREIFPWLFWLSPLVGALTGFAFVLWSPESSKGTSLIASLSRKDEPPLEKIPRAMGPLIVVSTWLSHLAGLSVGREGTAVQMGASMAASASPLFPNATPRLQHLLLLSGVAAGFGAVFGVPIAGAVFALELANKINRTGVRDWRSRLREFAIAFAMSSAADLVARGLHAHHTQYPEVPPLSEWLSFAALGGLLSAAVVFAALAWFFLVLHHQFKIVWSRLVPSAFWRPVVGGLVFAPMALAPFELQRFGGLGVSQITGSFTHVASFLDPAIKLLFTVFSLGTGFKGGEVTPLFFIGATAGSSLAGLWNLNPAMLASLGVVAVFGAAARVPLACTIMAGELFGLQIVPAAAIACFAAAKLCRRPGLYDI